MFDHLLGHQKNKDILTAMLHSDRFPNVVLLHGYDGVGKSDFARAIARAIIGVPQDQSNHPDCIEFFPDTKTNLYSMNGIRSIVQEASLSPFSARHKVFVLHHLDSVEEGGNALLKIFEEPPSYIHFICTTSKKESILPTLLSRMHRLAFNPLSLGEITSWIHTKYKKSNADQIALFSCGSLAKATLFCEIEIDTLFSHIKKLFLAIQEKNHFSLYEEIEEVELFIERQAIALEDLYECIITWLQIYSLPKSHLILEKTLQLSNRFLESNKKLIRKKIILEWFFFSLFFHIHP